MSDELAEKGSDSDFLEDYAYLLLGTGQNKEAFEIWTGLLNRDPQRYSTLYNVGTALHTLSRFDEATTYIQAAVKLRPGNRNSAEEYHLRYIDFLQKQRKQPAYATQHLFLDELTEVWAKRKRPPESFEKYSEFPSINTEGVAELLRQFPQHLRY